VLKEPAWSSDEDVHLLESVGLVLQVLSSDDESSAERVEATDGAEDVEDLYSLFD
jgi:hypothetical protein